MSKLLIAIFLSLSLQIAAAATSGLNIEFKGQRTFVDCPFFEGQPKGLVYQGKMFNGLFFAFNSSDSAANYGPTVSVTEMGRDALPAGPTVTARVTLKNNGACSNEVIVVQ